MLEPLDSIVLVGWSANLGTTWLAVSNNLANWATVQSTIVGSAFFGESVAGYITPFANGTSPGATVFCYWCNSERDTNQLSTHAVVFAARSRTGQFGLAGLGGLSLLLFRRQRK